MSEMQAAGRSPAKSSSRPDASLAEEQKAAKLLIDLLHQEQAMLIAADLDTLNMITERKAPIVASMSELATHRHRALAAAGFSANEAGMQAWVDAKANGLPLHPDASSAYIALLATARQAQEINRINGLLINTHMVRNQSALSALKVQTSSGNFYGPDGQATSRGVGRGLVVG